MGDATMLWAGRFAAPPEDALLRLTRSSDVDLRLLPYELEATRAHARALAGAALLDPQDADHLDSACHELLDAYRRGELSPADTDEDVHSLVERELTARLGAVGARIHAGRSRNDLVAADLRMWCKDAAGELRAATARLIEALIERAEEHAATVMPGYTHLQRAQPVSLGFHLLAHGYALARDVRRLEAARIAADVSPLGAGALAGSTLPLEPSVPADTLNFAHVFDNAMDATSERDFACDLVYACALCAVHLSRMAEEVVLWTSAEFAFAVLPDEWSTGSSMMPQKRNPDVAELVRGRAALVAADVGALLTLLKGLPLAYSRDLQEDKEVVFRAVDRLAGMLEATTHIVRVLRIEAGAMEEAARASGALATDLAELLVSRGLPFREAHGVVGALVRRLAAGGRTLSDATASELERAHPLFASGDVARLDPAAAVRARKTHGGTAPEEVRRQAERLRALVIGEARDDVSR